MNKILAPLVRNPRKVLLLDAIGAFITASILFIVARKYQAYFGLPESTLGFLSYSALFIFIYSFGSFLLLREISKIVMQGLMALNVSYCVLTLGLVIYLYSEITFLGMAYFAVEIIVILFLVSIEQIAAKGIRNNRKKE